MIIIFVIVVLYAIMASISFQFLVYLDIGVVHFKLIEDIYTTAIILSIFWPLSAIGLFSYFAGKRIFEYFVSVLPKEKK